MTVIPIPTIPFCADADEYKVPEESRQTVSSVAPESRTAAEQHYDKLIEERRSKGRTTYGKGLDHTDFYDWDRMALEEALDLSQYLAAQNIKLSERCRELEKRVNELLKVGV